jgi:DNA-binding NtrC family response regulator
VEQFMKKHASRAHQPVTRVSPEVLALLRKYPFPGNVRELENAVEHALVMCSGDEITVDHLPTQIVVQGERTQGFVHDPKSEKEVIQEALSRHHGNRAEAARELGMHRSTLWRKMKGYGLDK